MADVEAAVAILEEELFGRVLQFWARHSVDEQYGGFFNNLAEDGAVTDPRKHVWLQGRQVWMWARLYSACSDAELASPSLLLESAADLFSAGIAKPIALTRVALLGAARRGLDFLRKHAVATDGQVFFALSREGAPAAMQRKIYSATFLILALAEVERATGDQPELRAEALALLQRVRGWIAQPTLLRPSLPGAPALSPLGQPMILLNVYSELSEGERGDV
jgi:N-acylglucosamine 2-epimerase